MNPRELDVLNILWSSEAPMMATDIVNAGHGLTQSTVTAVLRKLLKEKLVDVVGVTHSGKVLSRTYRPTEASREVILENFTSNYGNFRNVISKSSICSAILHSDDGAPTSESEISELKEVIKEYEKKFK